MKIKYTLKQVYPGIFLCTIKNMYDLTMTFCRVQEFYESPFKQIRGKKFNLLDYMKIYSEQNGNFTYPLDWGGFNVPGHIVDKMFELGIDDFNCYDKIIKDIHKEINSKIETKNKYYLIGSNENRQTIEHECAHGLYFLNKKYKAEAKAILKKLSPSVYKKTKAVLLDMGYTKQVIDDEIQAYFSTEYNLLKQNTNFNKRELTNFTKVVLEFKHNFKQYRKQIKI